MNGEDLIRRDVAAFQACNWHVKPDAEVFNGIKASIRSQISLAPAVDAVEVVRCKDCRHWRQEVGSTVHWVCAQHSFDGRYMHTTPVFFCADGARKE